MPDNLVTHCQPLSVEVYIVLSLRYSCIHRRRYGRHVVNVIVEQLRQWLVSMQGNVVKNGTGIDDVSRLERAVVKDTIFPQTSPASFQHSDAPLYTVSSRALGLSVSVAWRSFWLVVHR